MADIPGRSEMKKQANNAPPVINIGSLRAVLPEHWMANDDCTTTVADIVNAAVNEGFFYIIDHGIPADHVNKLMSTTDSFFALPLENKRDVRMQLAGHSWRGWFPLGDEITSGKIDQKEGFYFGTEGDPSDKRPLRGCNLWPNKVPELKDIVLAHLEFCRNLGRLLMSALACGLGLASDHFKNDFEDPTELFRIFAYPPHQSKYGDDTFAVGEHTDYGYLTLLLQDDSGGLQVRDKSNTWIEVPPIADSLVVNLGDALQHCTGGLLRATPHRVNKRTGATQTRYSFPYFFDPNFEAQLASKVALMSPKWQQMAAELLKIDSSQQRWDGSDPAKFKGTYGTYLMRKISKVFPDLAIDNLRGELTL